MNQGETDFAFETDLRGAGDKMDFGVRHFARTGIVFVIAAISLLALSSSASAQKIRPTTDAGELSSAISGDPSLVTGSSFVTLPPGVPPGYNTTPVSPAAVSDELLAGFATDGPDYAILSTGDPRIADLKNISPGSGAEAGGDSFQGVDNHDVTVMKVDVNVPSGADCLTLNYRFLSEEFNEWVGAGYNDSFILQLDRYDWQAGESAVSAPGDFATTGPTIGIDSTGDYAVNEGNAAGTTYDGATGLVTAKTRATPGAHSIYVSIFDQGDDILDTAVFLDNLRASHQEPGHCEPPAVTNPAAADPTKDSGIGSLDSDINRFSSRVKAKDLKGFSGTASSERPISRVEIALVSLKKGAKAARRHAPRCVALNSRRLMTQRRTIGKKCADLLWVSADGTDSWHFDLKRKLPKGNYVLYSRAVDERGAIEAGWSATDHNKVTFSVN